MLCFSAYYTLLIVLPSNRIIANSLKTTDTSYSVAPKSPKHCNASSVALNLPIKAPFQSDLSFH